MQGTDALPRGVLVRSVAGRDAGCWFCVVGEAAGLPLLCDGRERPLQRPKRKNRKHIEPLPAIAPLGEEALRGNKALRKTILRLRRENGEE
ncbi:MAG: KOW domain-containing RNA-binding protein [Oscillospiraceae bacterium]|jgi:hypothetical protein|nr:KOW domain-containing RNA-binding protein [Oscillospiraceae bacterium]